MRYLTLQRPLADRVGPAFGRSPSGRSWRALGEVDDEANPTGGEKSGDLRWHMRLNWIRVVRWALALLTVAIAVSASQLASENLSGTSWLSWTAPDFGREDF